MILAKKNGWMIMGDVVNETEYGYTFKPVDSQVPVLIPKTSTTSKIFDDVYKAEQWITEGIVNDLT